MGLRDIQASPPVENHGSGVCFSLKRSFIRKNRHTLIKRRDNSTPTVHRQSVALPLTIFLVWLGHKPLLALTAIVIKTIKLS